jgi:hypothetical protein
MMRGVGKYLRTNAESESESWEVLAAVYIDQEDEETMALKSLLVLTLDILRQVKTSTRSGDRGT